jgi:uncharacterized protein (DUF362 family)
MKRKEIEGQSHPIYSKTPSTVYIVQKKNKRRCMDEAIEISGFLSHLDSRWKASGKEKEEFLIVIKPNFMCAAFEVDISVYTDVELLEHLIRRIKDQGYSKVKVVESQMVWSIFYKDRTVKKVAALLGYSGDGYEIVDLSMEAEIHDYGDPTLGHHTAAKSWREADYRISFAKNKTHFQSYYTGCMKNVYGCLPKRDKLKHYHGQRREFEGSTIAILEAFPVHYCFIDAYFSGDGLAGLIRDNSPNETNTIICGDNCLAVDWVQGEKMGLDPLKNAVVRRGVERWGKPRIDRIGPTDKYDPWRNILPGVSAVANLIEEYYHVAKLFCFVFAYRMHPRFELVDDWTCSLTRPFRFCAKTVDFHMGLILSLLVLILLFLFLSGLVKWDIAASEVRYLVDPVRYGIAFSIFTGGVMHLLGLITALRRGWSLPRICWFFFLFAIVLYPVSAVMILDGMSLGYWITLVAPCVGGLFIFIGFFQPKSRFLMLLAGTHESEITWMGFLQIASESLAVAGAAITIYLG